MEMSSSNPVRSDPLPDWERELLHKEKELDRLPQPRLPSRQEVQEHELAHIPYRSWCAHCAQEERGQHMTTWSIDYAFMIDNGDLCTREEMERVGWDKTRAKIWPLEESAHILSQQKETAWIAGKIKDDIEEFGYGGACSYQVGSRTSDC